MLLKVAIVENMNVDEKITSFLHNEKIIYESKQLKETFHSSRIQSRKCKEKEKNIEEKNNELMKKWQLKSRKEIKIASMVLKQRVGN